MYNARLARANHDRADARAVSVGNLLNSTRLPASAESSAMNTCADWLFRPRRGEDGFSSKDDLGVDIYQWRPTATTTYERRVAVFVSLLKISPGALNGEGDPGNCLAVGGDNFADAVRFCPEYWFRPQPSQTCHLYFSGIRSEDHRRKDQIRPARRRPRRKWCSRRCCDGAALGG